MKENNKAIIYALIAALSWATVPTALKITLRSYNHYEMLIVSSLTALCLFFIIITIQSKWHLLKKISKKEWWRFALTGLLNPVAYYLVLFKAYDLLPAQVAQPINYIWPIILAVLLAGFARQLIPKVKYIGMIFSLGGVIFISLGSGSISDGAGLSLYGFMLALLSAFLWAVFWIVNKMNSKIDNTICLFLSFLFGSIYLIAGTLFVNVNLDSTSGLFSSAYVGIFEMGIPFVFFSLALRKTTNPALINQLCYLSPFMSLFIIHFILKEHVYFTTYIGLFFIIGGILFNEYAVRKNR